MADLTIYTTHFDKVVLETPADLRDPAGGIRIRFQEGSQETRLIIRCDQVAEISSQWLHALEAYDRGRPKNAAVHYA